MQLTKIASLMAVDKATATGSFMATVNRYTRGKGLNVGKFASHEDNSYKNTIKSITKAHANTQTREHLLNGRSKCAKAENLSDKTY